MSTKNDIAEKDKIFVDGEEIAGLVSVAVRLPSAISRQLVYASFMSSSRAHERVLSEPRWPRTR